MGEKKDGREAEDEQDRPSSTPLASYGSVLSFVCVLHVRLTSGRI